MTPSYRDPFAIVWDQLAAKQCRPHGRPHDFRARCPLHGDNDSSLHVWDDGDGVVQMHCFARQCERDDIMSVLGLRWQDRYPLGYFRNPAKRLAPVRRTDFTGNAHDPVNIWLAATKLDMRWGAWLWLDECPSCGWAYFSLSVGSEREAETRCPRGCDIEWVTQALADRLSESRRVA